MKKIFTIFLTVVLITLFTGCGINQTNLVMKAWTGECSDEKFADAINKYQTSYIPIVSNGKSETASVSIKTDFEISYCAVTRLSFVDNNDINAELHGGIYLLVETSFEGKEATVSTDWWYTGNDDWTKNYTLWSYLVCIKDMDGVEHYYYFRTDYSSID